MRGLVLFRPDSIRKYLSSVYMMRAMHCIVVY